MAMDTSVAAERNRHTALRGTVVVAVLVAAKLILHIATVNGYGIFRDEFYYWACGQRLAWGYVDQPPMTPALVRLGCALLGDTALGIRVFAMLAGGALVWMTSRLAREFGAGLWGQAMAGIAVIIAPIWLGLHHMTTVNAFEPLFWTGCAWAAVRAIKTGEGRWWLWFGFSAGLGLENKHSTLFFCFAFAAGLLLTRQRRWLRSPYLWGGALIAALLYAPTLIWQAQHGWPQLELLVNGSKGKNYVMGLPEFIQTQVLLLNPVVAPIWLAGIWFFFAGRGREYRILGWTWLVVFGTIVALHGKAYYPIPAYPMLIAGGAAAIEAALTARPRLGRLRPAAVVVALAAGVVIAPLALPLLPVETFIRYSAALGISQPRTENLRQGRLPQTFADMHGWENMAATVARVCHSLPPEDQAKAILFGQNYGEAGALEFYAKRYGLPPAISKHNNYWLWGPRGASEIMIVIGGNLREMQTLFEGVDEAAVIVSEYAMPYETNLPVYICRKLRVPLSELWPRLKMYI